jgi:hypothetical protein
MADLANYDTPGVAFGALCIWLKWKDFIINLSGNPYVMGGCNFPSSVLELKQFPKYLKLFR